jgi:hypothetical protein
MRSALLALCLLVPAVALAGSWYTPPQSGGGASDATELTYTPATLGDWSGGIDPGECSDALDQLAGRVDTLEEAGGATCGAYDWADPCYEQGGDDLSSVPAANWPDAEAAGAVNGVCRDEIASRVLRVRANLDSDCSTDYGTTNRTLGILRSIGVGDFRVALRYVMTPTNWDDYLSVAVAGPIFVDGTDASADSWYGAGAYYTTERVREGTGTLYRLSSNAGANRFETYNVYTAVETGVGARVDAVLERSGTTLAVWMGPTGGPLHSMGTHTVSAGAGLIGLRTQTALGTNSELDLTLVAYRTGLSEVPW